MRREKEHSFHQLLTWRQALFGGFMQALMPTKPRIADEPLNEQIQLHLASGLIGSITAMMPTRVCCTATSTHVLLEPCINIIKLMAHTINYPACHQASLGQGSKEIGQELRVPQGKVR